MPPPRFWLTFQSAVIYKKLIGEILNFAIGDNSDVDPEYAYSISPVHQTRILANLIFPGLSNHEICAPSMMADGRKKNL